ncbi:MAG: hypothetical protein DRH12_07010 [Deltaproteobacteria bacterium]|nr:MAG: hypothetical protein DRH12_07010 [Deltaproteobacteria bacterium]
MGKLDNAHSSEEFHILREAVESTNEGFVTIDENHRVIFFNRAAERIFGYSRDEVLGKDLTTIMTPSCARDHKESVKSYLQTGRGKSIGHERELIATRKNGQQFPVEISFSVTVLKGRHYFTGLVRDLTETKQLQQRILQSERLAALGQLVAEITHEIKNPLMTIGGFARQVARTAPDEKVAKKLNIIVAEVKRLEDLLTDLREYYLPRKLELGPVDIKQLLLEIKSMLKDTCEKKNIKITANFDEKLGLVLGDTARLKQVFLNLVKNAMEATQRDGHIHLEAKAMGDKVKVSVTDDGPGISEEDQAKIFSPFFTTKSHGSGLGLCVTKRIVDEHPEGSIRVISQMGKGTTFEVTLALSLPENEPPSQAAPREKPGDKF